MALTKIGSIGINTGIQFAGVTTIATLNGSDSVLSVGGTVNFTSDVSIGGSVSIGGTLTYEDVTNVDSVGIITARNGIVVGSGITLSPDGDIFATGITTVSGNVKVGSGITLSPDGDIFVTGITTFIGNVHVDTDIGGEDNRLLVGTNSSRNIGGSSSSGYIQLEGTSANSSSFTLINNQANTQSPNIRFGKTRGSSTGGVTIIADGDSLGKISFTGADGVDLENNTAQIKALVNGTVAENQIPTDIIFETSATNSTGRAERLRITSDGKIGVNATSPAALMHVSGSYAAPTGGFGGSVYSVISNSGAADNSCGLSINAGNNGVSFIQFGDTDDANIGTIEYSHSDNSMVFDVNASERARVTSDGRVLINSTTSRNIGANISRMLQIESSGGGAGIAVARNSNDTSGPSLDLGKSRGYPNTIVQDGDKLGVISFSGADGTSLQISGAQITGEVDGTPGSNDMPGRIVFKTTSDGASSTTERARITKTGRLLVATTTSSQNGADGYIQSVVAGTSLGAWGSHAGSTGTRRHMRFSNPNGVIGSIHTSGSGVAFNTSSDYRLKENQSAISNAISKINQLKPYTFNFKANPSEKIDGFFAHEVQELIPYAVDGEKDGEEMQGIDYGKLTPLLTAALQEAVAKIEVLESKVASLGG